MVRESVSKRVRSPGPDEATHTRREVQLAAASISYS